MIESTLAATGNNLSKHPDQWVYSQHDLWYFRIESGDEIGPFRYRSEAESSLARMLAEQNSN